MWIVEGSTKSHVEKGEENTRMKVKMRPREQNSEERSDELTAKKQVQRY